MKDEDLLEKEFTLELPEYLLVHLRKRARECGCTISFIIQRILFENFQKRGVNVFRENVDKRSAAYRRERKPYKRKPGRPSKEKVVDVDPDLPPVLSTDRIQMEK